MVTLDLQEYVTHLTPKQERHLRLIINNDHELPPVGELLVEPFSSEDDAAEFVTNLALRMFDEAR